MNRLIAFLLIIFQLGVMAMAKDEVTSQELSTEGISRELARHRAATISDLRYKLSFILAPGEARIKGHQEIRLKLAGAADPVILDFRDLDPQGRVIEGDISNVTVNDAAVTDLRQTGGHIVLPALYFRIGENTIQLDFESGVAAA